MRRLRIVFLVLWLVPACRQAAGLAASGGGGGGTIPALNHVFIVVEENTDYADVTSSSMPYLDSLAGAYGLATQYYADTHPSIGNYFMMTVGNTITNDDSYAQTVASDNIVRHLVAAGKTWKAYAEDLPSVGDTTVDLDNGTYASRHNPVVYLTDVHDNATQAHNVVPFMQFATDLANNAFPNYAFIVPNLCNDAHDCSLGTADAWLQTNIDPLVRSTQFQQDGLLIVLFDESGSDNTHGGGRIVCVVVSSKAKRGYQSTTLYQHASTLRLTAKVLGLTSFPNQAASAPDMSEFFTP
ncbi:MAG TPA: alkaline phosphatase family protein [Gemmatimonadales bacterium]|nr:alkaline phosphatase family protein [Gemmatimonadales bacterium]